MKPIELSKVQKAKLLKMCEDLFPKENFNHIDKNGNLCEETIYDRSWIYLNNIDWFEFCHEYLPPKVLGDTNLIFCGPNRPHPIDYLCEQFKQLKQ